MRLINQCITSFLALGLGPLLSSAVADTFGLGPNSFEIQFVQIGAPGNPRDANPNPAGAVDYRYRIGKFEVSEQMIDKANALGALGITKDTRGPDMPATSVTWFEAARFVNSLNISTGNVPAYKFDPGGNFQLWQPTDPGYDASNLYRNKLAKYFLPTVHEWHKATYYDPSRGAYYVYPTRSDSVPDGIDYTGDPVFDAVFYDGGLNDGPNDITNVGLASPYGTLGQGGNAAEWAETAFGWRNDNPRESRIFAGGAWGDGPNLLAAWNSTGSEPRFEAFYRGFRVSALVPEPNSFFALAGGILTLLTWAYRSRRERSPKVCG
jgi:hypothetical protein